MITSNLTDEQLKFLLYGIRDESYEVMARLRQRIEHICKKCDALWCEELYLLLGLDFPKELKPYGWKNLKDFLNGKWLFIYQPFNEETDDMWHISLPLPEKLEEDFETWKTKNS